MAKIAKKVSLFASLFVIAAIVSVAAGQRFVENKDGTVKDTKTGLVWTRDANIAGKGMIWPDALAFVNGLNKEAYLGRKDWRLPKIAELASLVERRPDLPQIHFNLGRRPFDKESAALLNSTPAGLPDGHPFINVVSFWYWSRTDSTECPNAAQVVNMATAQTFIDGDKIMDPFFVWPVRGRLRLQD